MPTGFAAQMSKSNPMPGTSQPLNASQTKPLEGGASFSLGNRVLRAVWMLTWLIFAQFTPPPLHGWRRLVLRLFGAKLGAGARVHGRDRKSVV